MNTHVRFGRRKLLFAAAAVALGGPTGMIGRASAHTSAGGLMSAVSKSLGGFDVLALVDASGPFFLDRQRAFPEATQADWDRALTLDPGAFGAGLTWELDFRCFAIRGPGEHLMLVDTGVGPEGSPASSWAPVPGDLPDELALAGIDPRDVDTVVLTHLHEDHFGWSVGMDGTPMFPNARYVIQQEEISALAESDAAWNYIVSPLRATGQLDQVAGSALLAASKRAGGSLRVMPTPGHTPGHQSVVVDSPEQQVVVTGDVLVHAVQLVNPDVAYRFEADQEVARRTRRGLLAEAAGRRTVLATAHLKQPFVTVP